MSAGEKFTAGMYMIYVCAYEYLTHAEKNKLLRVAYRLIREAMLDINKSVIDKEEIPF